jgi:hypothetical protein
MESKRETSIRDSLTIEQLNREFKSNFELVNYAISIAKSIVTTGRDSRVPTDVKNPAYWALLEIEKGRDVLQDVESTEEEGEEKEEKEEKAEEVQS